MNKNKQTPQRLPRAETNTFISNGITYSTMDVAGFGPDDIDAYMQDDILIIEGTRESKFIIEELDYNDLQFVIPSSFENRIKLSRNVKVESIIVENGICLIQFEKVEAEKSMIEVR